MVLTFRRNFGEGSKAEVEQESLGEEHHSGEAGRCNQGPEADFLDQ
jgi:hypothetical protein